jgi:hypothetical protein
MNLKLEAPFVKPTSESRSDPHVALSSCSLHITRVDLLARQRCCQTVPLAVTTRPPAAPARASPAGASATFLSMRVCRRSAAGDWARDARLLARSLSGAAAEAATPAPAPPAPPARLLARPGLRPPRHCGAAESGFIGRRRRLCRALYPASIGRGLRE